VVIIPMILLRKIFDQVVSRRQIDANPAGGIDLDAGRSFPLLSPSSKATCSDPVMVVSCP
jgi:hypothetical protein